MILQHISNTLILLSLLTTQSLAKRNLVATSMVTCKENSQLSPNNFDVVFNPDDRSLHYTVDVATEMDGFIYADIDVWAYGFKVITKTVDLCSLNWKQFCPVHPGNIQIDSIEYISKEYTDEIPGIAYTVPDIDGYAKVRVYSDQGEYLACMQIFFTNGKTVTHNGVKWVTAIIAGIGLLVSAVMSTFGNSTAASHIAAVTVSLFLYFQSVVVVSMEHVHRVPPIAASWAENLAWSMGLIRVSFMQKIFRWYVQSTGGTPSLYLTSKTLSILAQKRFDSFVPSFLKKRDVYYDDNAIIVVDNDSGGGDDDDDGVLFGNVNTLIFRGIERLGHRLGIENTSIVCTGFTFFVLCGYVLAGFIIFCKCAVDLCIRNGWMKKNKFQGFRRGWNVILKGALMRYIYIGFTQLLVLSFWEFTRNDSPAVVLIACLFFLLPTALMVLAAYRTISFARRSIRERDNPAALLFGDERVLHRYGFFYTMFKAKFYWWNIVVLSYIFVKAAFIGFSQGSGKLQALVIWFADLAYVIGLCYYRPYLDKRTNIINICISVVTVLNSFLFLFFSDLFGQPYKVSAVMGWIFFILNAAFSLILLLMILFFTGLALLSKNPDLRFKPAKDDRNSFQLNSEKQDMHMWDDNSQTALRSLFELSQVAQDHEPGWQGTLLTVKSEEGFGSVAGSDEELSKKNKINVILRERSGPSLYDSNDPERRETDTTDSEGVQSEFEEDDTTIDVVNPFADEAEEGRSLEEVIPDSETIPTDATLGALSSTLHPSTISEH